MTDKKINIALAVAHKNRYGDGSKESEMHGKRGAFIRTPHGDIFEYDFSKMVTEKLYKEIAGYFGYTDILMSCDVEDIVVFINHKGDDGKLLYDLALTIHFDSYDEDWRDVTRVFYGEHFELAFELAEGISASYFDKRNVKRVQHGQGGYKSMEFIRDTDMPALLIEAFNGKDPAIEALFADGLHSERAQAWMDNFVAGIAAGIKEYYDTCNHNPSN